MLLRPLVQNVYHVRHGYGAAWTSSAFRQTSDTADFGPPATRDPRADNPVPVGSPKPVKYLPVPRRAGEEKIPALSLMLGLSEEGKIRAVQVPAWEGAEVLIEVVNLWDPAAPKKVELKGTLQKLVCKVEVSKDTLRSWLDPKGPLGALVNENLLDFRFRIPKIDESGSVFAGESQNRVFLYRRKVLVFFPGVFGSQVQFTTPDGQKFGFPDFFQDDTVPTGPHAAEESVGKLGEALGTIVFSTQKVGVLECDDAGKPLRQPDKPTLLRLNIGKPQAYDCFTSLHEAARRRFSQLPESFRLYTLFIAPYDWRCDLTETARAKLEDLKELQDGEFVSRAPDTDDQVALVGHSTGGLLVRRMLVEPKAADSLVSHAFFQNVPFRGAPKTFTVMATGRDPLDGDPMLPFVDPESLRSVALTVPVIYHLSPSPKYPKHEPIFTGNGPGIRTNLTGLDAERAWIELAIHTGLMPNRKIVPAREPLDAKARGALALRASAWHEYWEEYCERRRGRTLVEWLYPHAPPNHWAERELAKRGLVDQDALRVEQGWNQKLADAASAFHSKCEEWAVRGPWADRCYLFYSVAEEATTLCLDAKLVHAEELPVVEFLKAVGVTMADTRGEVVLPPRKRIAPDDTSVGEKELKEKGDVWVVERWYPSPRFMYGHRLFGREVWRFATLRQVDGDGTVPLESQLGFGGKAKVFKRIEDRADGTGPAHVPASNHPWVWDRILETLQGRDPKEHLAKPNEANPETGIDHDPRLKVLRSRYANS